MKKKTLNVINPIGHAPLASADDLNKGLFMRSQIYADTRAKCVLCGKQEFIIKKMQAYGNLEFPVCSSLNEETKKPCEGNPHVYRVRRFLPVESKGGAKRLDIRYDRGGQRLTQPYQVATLISLLDQEILSNKFDPTQYQGEEVRREFIFEVFLEKEYKPAQFKKKADGKITKNGLKNKKTAWGHLEKIFKGVDIREIRRGVIKKEFDTFSGGYRTSVLAFGELRVILTYAFDLEKIESVPKFPEFKAPPSIDSKKLISREAQLLIASKVEPWYQAPIRLLIDLGVRPCDIRTLRRNDIDLDANLIHFDEHDSAGELTPGRKSDRAGKLTLTIDKDFFEIMRFVKLPEDPMAFIFKGRKGEIMSEKVLSNAWNRAKKKLLNDKAIPDKLKAEIKDTGLYVGTRHSTLSQIMQSGVSTQGVMLVSGHTNERMAGRYAMHTDETRLAEVRSIFDKLKERTA